MRRLVASVVLTFACLGSGTAFAQDAERPPLEEFSAMRFSPAPGPGNFLAVEGARVSGHLVPSGGLTLDYAYRPFTLYDASCAPDDETDCEVEDVNTHLVRYYAAGHLTGAISIAERVQVGLVLPLAYVRNDDFSYTLADGSDFVAIEGGRSFGLGDPRLSVKARIFGEGTDGLHFAASAFVTAPIGQLTTEDSFLGEDSVTAGGHFIGEFSQRGFHVAGNVGGVYRPERTLFSTEVGSQITYAVAFGYDVTPLVLVFGELQGASSFSAQVDENPLEGRIAGRYRVGDLSFTLGAGAGLISGVGIPVFRAIGQAQYAPVRGDADGDGIDDRDDACPSEAEDLDGWIDDDGCPEEDNDDDGFLDADDQCPNDPEDRDEHEDEDGCPDPDNDGDGVLDGYDSCPNDPEDMDGDRDEDGCPDADTDRDGIEDVDDQCPNEPEDTDGFGDEDGCPETDFDSDGIPDDRDECPDQAENINGVEDEDGCPEQDSDSDGVVDSMDQCEGRAENINGVDDEDGCPDGPDAVALAEDRVTLTEPMQWRRRTNLTPAARRQLSAVAFAMKGFPQLARVTVRVTASSEEIAQGRAEAIVARLGEEGIGADRLRTATSTGEDDVVFVAGH